MSIFIRVIVFGLCLAPIHVFSQNAVSLDEAIALAREKNPAVLAGNLSIQQQEALKGAVIDLPQTEVSFLYGQFNSIHRNDNNITVSQTVPFPSVFTSGSKLVKSRIAQAGQEASWTEAQVIASVRRKFNEILFLKERHTLLLSQDSIFRELVRIAKIRQETGEGTRIEVTAAESQLMQVSNALERSRIDVVVSLRQLAMLCVVDEIPDVRGTLRDLFPLVLVDSDSAQIERSPRMLVQAQKVKVAHNEKQFELARALPSFTIGIFSQTLIGLQTVDGVDRFFSKEDRFHGIQLGVTVPLFFNAANARVKSSRYAAEAAEQTYADLAITIGQDLLALRENIRKNLMSVSYYERTGLPHADLFVSQARRSFQEGEVEYGTLLINVRQALAIREEYVDTLYMLNDNMISLLQLTEE